MLTSVLVSVTISNIAYQAPILVNPILAGQFVNSDAISAIALTSPILELCFALILLLAVGSSYQVAEYISGNQIHEARNHFSVAIVSSTVALFLLAIATFLFRFALADCLSGGSEAISTLISDYLSVQSWAFIPYGFYYALDYHLLSEGKVRFTARCNIAFAVLYLILVFAFIVVFKTGLCGFALASIISTVAVILTALNYMKKESLLKLVNVRKDFSTYLRRNVIKGFPVMADDVLDILFFFLSNLIVMAKVGASGYVVWGITCTFLSVAVGLGAIVTESSLTLGYALCKSRDYVGCRHMISSHRLVTWSVTLFLIAFVSIFPETILSFFGVPASAASVLHIRMAIPLMLMFSIVVFEGTNYYLLNYSGRYMFMILTTYISPVVLLLLFSFFTAESLWLSFVISALAGLILAFIVKFDIDRRFSTLSEHAESLELSLPYHMDAVALANESVSQFLRENNISAKQMNAVEHCIDELSYNIIKHGTTRLKTKTFDLRAIAHADHVSIIFKYDGIPFNPIIAFQDTAIESMNEGKKSQLALRIFNHYALSPFYQYAYGVNTLTMNVPSHAS